MLIVLVVAVISFPFFIGFLSRLSFVQLDRAQRSYRKRRSHQFWAAVKSSIRLRAVRLILSLPMLCVDLKQE